MKLTLNQVIEGTITLVLIYLVLRNAYGFSSIINSLSSAYVRSVAVLQGR